MSFLKSDILGDMFFVANDDSFFPLNISEIIADICKLYRFEFTRETVNSFSRVH